jgi:hypothetical protein
MKAAIVVLAAMANGVPLSLHRPVSTCAQDCLEVGFAGSIRSYAPCPPVVLIPHEVLRNRAVRALRDRDSPRSAIHRQNAA